LKSENASLGYWNSLKTQEVFRDNNKAGKDLIGVSSIANTFHSFAQDINVRLRETMVLNGHSLKSLNATHSIKNGELEETTFTDTLICYLSHVGTMHRAPTLYNEQLSCQLVLLK